MSQNKTQPTSVPVKLFLNGIQEEEKRADIWKLYELMEHLTNAKGRMWGTSIVGFGEYHYKYKTGREGDWFICGFSPRKNALTLYLMCDLSQLSFEGLGKYKNGKGCLYIKKLRDIDFQVLERIVKSSINSL
ncbi:MAG: DUF1801 domain-containing protein [Flavobacteriaceae bacterium]|nr:DUF1801 domain-containing protein [Flavobacteriaceae bacterium]